MKRLVTFLSILVTAIVVAIPLAVEAAVVTDSYQYRGASVEAYAWKYDGCVYVSANIWAAENVSHISGGAPVESAYASAYLWGYNWCTGANLWGGGWTESGPSINALNGATLSVPVSLYSQSCTWDPNTGWWSCNTADLGTATLTAQLTGTGDVYSGLSMSQSSSGPYRSFSRSQGDSRPADSAMSLILNGTDILATSASWGNLYRSNSGSHWFYRY
jgi:hypothetical protein